MLFCVFYGEDQWNLSPLNAQNNVNGIGAQGREHVYAESDPAMMAVQEGMVRRIVAELRGCDNVYFELCNEPYFDGPALGSPWNDRLIRAIREVSDRHLVALNVASGSQMVEQVPEGLLALNFHNGGTQADLVLDLPGGFYRADWINPGTGAIDKSEAFAHEGGSRTLKSPVYRGDVSLRILSTNPQPAVLSR